MSSSYKTYSSPGFRAFGLGPLSLAILMVGALVLMLPFTQYLAGFKKDDSTVRKFEIAPPPPNFTPPEPPPPPPQEQTEPPPQMDTPPPQLSLSQLTMDISPGIGSAMVGTFAVDSFGVTADDTLAQAKLFEIGELDSVPSLRNRSAMGRVFGQIISRTAPNVRRNKIPLERASAEVRINADGSCDLIRFIEITELEYEESILAFLAQVRFTIPTVNGEAVAARYIFPLTWSWQ